MSDGIVARLRAGLPGRADFSGVLPEGWTGLGPGELARRPVGLDGQAGAALGDFFDLRGEAAGRIRFEGDLAAADRLGAGLAEGEVIVAGGVGADTGLAMSGGALDVHGDAGPNAGGAAVEARRGMTGGELVVRGSVGERAGLRMRRGLIVVGGSSAGWAGEATIAGSVLIFGDAGPAPGLWSKRGSIVALGAVEVPPTYRYACTYRPDHLGVTLIRLRERYRLPVTERQLNGLYRRYSGDLADLGKGEILAWTPA